LAIFSYTRLKSFKLSNSVANIAIRDLQGEGLFSPFANQHVTTSGVVTGVVRRGFFLQTPNKAWDGKGSDAIFVYSRDWKATKGAALVVSGECLDYVKHETAKPVTQLRLESAQVKSSDADEVEAITLTQPFLPNNSIQLAALLNSLEGMLLAIEPGQTFISPSNKFGDYVVALDSPALDKTAPRTAHGGFIGDHQNELRWLPGFRATNYNHAQRLNVGAKLMSRIEGPLNYRVDSYQMAVSDPFEIEPSFIDVGKSRLTPSAGALTIMTLNCFNLDPNVESSARVKDPRQDVDDDWGEGRFHTLAQAVVLQANSPDIVALQEIQDSDGAEITNLVDAAETYRLLILTIKQLSGIDYEWVDVSPELGADGGQPGGNIRNGYLYNPNRVSFDPESLHVIGKGNWAFDDSRKPLVCDFIENESAKRLTLINVHLASKRHQESIFAPLDPGSDGKLGVRVEQAHLIHREAQRTLLHGNEYYITGDFNDSEFSRTLEALCADDAANLVMQLPEVERYDYNHRGKLQVLMHGIVSATLAKSDKVEYEIIHGNELIGVMPGEESDRPSDHAYVIAKITF
jgi:predicted extracellular nuclease